MSHKQNCYVECYDTQGDKIDGFVTTNPILGLLELAQMTISKGGCFDYITASCYIGQTEQWTMEIK